MDVPASLEPANPAAAGQDGDAPVAHRRRARRVTGIPQLPWRRLVNPYSPVQILSMDQLEAIHRTSLRILAEIGLEVLGDRAIDLLGAAGATIDRSNRRVRLDPGLVEATIRTAPPAFELHARNPDRSIAIGGRNLVFTSVGGPAFVTDLDRGRRPGNAADLRDYVRVIGALDVIHQEAGGPLEATDLPVGTRHLDLYELLATTLDKTWQCLGAGLTVVDDAIEVACLARGIDRDRLLREPSLMTIINSNSPLRLDGPMSDGLIEMAIHGQPVVATPFTLAGAMSPATIAGALAEQNAEALFMVVLTQLARPGAPVVYGGFTSNVDMRTGSPAFGTPEYVKAAFATGQLARRYGLPFRSSNVTGSSTVDAQAAYESEMAVWGAVMGGVNLLYQGAGWLEGGLTASFEKLILDAEILQMISEVLQPLVVDDAEMGLDAIAAVGPGGHFFGSPHTLERFEHAFYQPMLADWRNFETWQEDGALRADQRANRIWKQLLSDFEPPPMEPSVRESIGAFVARRKREIEALGPA
ncbi:MAG: trimethylamine methyltransferase family protein [Candidatus Limnocylindrales bacterium]